MTWHLLSPFVHVMWKTLLWRQSSSVGAFRLKSLPNHQGPATISIHDPIVTIIIRFPILKWIVALTIISCFLIIIIISRCVLCHVYYLLFALSWYMSWLTIFKAFNDSFTSVILLTSYCSSNCLRWITVKPVSLSTTCRTTDIPNQLPIQPIKWLTNSLFAPMLVFFKNFCVLVGLINYI